MNGMGAGRVPETSDRASGCRGSRLSSCSIFPSSQYSPVGGGHEVMPAGAHLLSVSSGAFPYYSCAGFQEHPAERLAALRLFVFWRVMEPCHRRCLFFFRDLTANCGEINTPLVGSRPLRGQMEQMGCRRSAPSCYSGLKYFRLASVSDVLLRCSAKIAGPVMAEL